MKNPHNKQFGKIGEEIATRYLKRNGHQILERNFQYGHLEIDIITRLGEEIVFVEVKTRTDDAGVLPEKAVGKSKQRNMRIAAEAYLDMHDLLLPARFDIVS